MQDKSCLSRTARLEKSDFHFIVSIVASIIVIFIIVILIDIIMFIITVDV